MDINQKASDVNSKQMGRGHKLLNEHHLPRVKYCKVSVRIMKKIEILEMP